MSKIKLYTLNNCIPCKQMKHLFSELNINYEEIPIDNDLDKEEFQHILAVPFLVILKDDGTETQHYGAIGKDHLIRLIEDE